MPVLAKYEAGLIYLLNSRKTSSILCCTLCYIVALNSSKMFTRDEKGHEVPRRQPELQPHPGNWRRRYVRKWENTIIRKMEGTGSRATVQSNAIQSNPIQSNRMQCNATRLQSQSQLRPVFAAAAVAVAVAVAVGGEQQQYRTGQYCTVYSASAVDLD